MALRVKDVATAREKFVNRGSAAASDYANGVKGSGGTWQAHAIAAAPVFAAGIQEAITRDAYAKGVAHAGGAKYEARATGVGATRYPQGIRDAGPAWEQGASPYLQLMAGLTLPPRRPKGDPLNIQRVQAINDANRKKKVSG